MFHQSDYWENDDRTELNEGTIGQFIDIALWLKLEWLYEIYFNFDIVFFKPTKSFIYKFTSPFVPLSSDDIYNEQY